MEEEKKQVRVFMDGAFDVMHYGHMNAFRLGRSLGTTLVVGVNSDESIKECKGPPLMNDQERLTMVESCKFVDEVVPGCPYIMNHAYLEYIFEKYKVDYVVHGDDPCIVDGRDVYETAKSVGKYRSIPRTEGISTTHLMGRILAMSRDNNNNNNQQQQRSNFLTTSHILHGFSAGNKTWEPGMKVVYIDGAWDLFNCGHVTLLKAAKQHGDYLVVGVFADDVVHRLHGKGLPLMNQQERVLSVLGCRFVDDVLLDAPYEITEELIQRLNVTKVVHSTVGYDLGMSSTSAEDERYRHVRSVLTVLESPSTFNPHTIIDRIHNNRDAFQNKYERKKKAEQDYVNDKYSKA